jgi:2,3-bisphosphoglycerate-dependent phosphoglycerate mutase
MRLSNVTRPAFEAHRHWAGDEPTRILFVRHGETDWNVRRIIQGWTGTSLNALGRKQAALMAGRVAKMGLSIDKVLSSDLGRAHQTASILAKRLKLPVHKEPLLRERRFGEWEGKRIEEVLASFKLGPKARKDPFLAFDPKGGESMAVFAKRMRRFLDKVVRLYPGQTIAAVSHGGPVRIAACLATGIPPKVYFRLGRPGNVSLSLLGHQGGVWWAEFYNDMSHLEGVPGSRERAQGGKRG